MVTMQQRRFGCHHCSHLLAWLPLVLSAMSELPTPVNISLSTSHVSHILKWEHGPHTPAGVYYNVSFSTQRGSNWIPVAGCEHVQKPLVCNLTKAFSDPLKIYVTKITTVMETQAPQSVIVKGYKPITHLGLPLLTVTSCGKVLCVDLQPPVEHLWKSYNVLNYQLQIKSDSGDGAQFIKDTRSLTRVNITDLAPGRRYCISVRFSDSLEAKESSFGPPKCAFTPGIYSADTLISAVLCFSVLAVLVIVALLVWSGFICLKSRPLPSVLASFRHMEEIWVLAPCRPSLSSHLNVKTLTPSAGEKRSRQSLSDESDGESVTETTGGRSGGGYKLWMGTNLFSSSSSSRLLVPLSLKPKLQPSLSSNQPSDISESQPKAHSSVETHSSAGPNHTLSTDTNSLTGKKITADEESKEVVGEGDSQDVNLLTLIFGRLEEEQEKSHLDMPEVETESLCVSEECSAAPVPPSQTWATEEVTTETDKWCADEEEEEEEEETDEYSGYMGRPCTDV